jgi:hypothetical protein
LPGVEQLQNAEEDFDIDTGGFGSVDEVMEDNQENGQIVDIDDETNETKVTIGMCFVLYNDISLLLLF